MTFSSSPELLLTLAGRRTRRWCLDLFVDGGIGPGTREGGPDAKRTFVRPGAWSGSAAAAVGTA